MSFAPCNHSDNQHCTNHVQATGWRSCRPRRTGLACLEHDFFRDKRRRAAKMIGPVDRPRRHGDGRAGVTLAARPLGVPGSSLEVDPAASLPILAKRNGYTTSPSTAAGATSSTGCGRRTSTACTRLRRADDKVIELHGNTTCLAGATTRWVRRSSRSTNGCRSALACGGIIKTATISFGQSMPEAEMRAGAGGDARGGPFHRARQLAGGLSGRRLSDHWPSATARASSSSTASRPTRTSWPTS